RRGAVRRPARRDGARARPGPGRDVPRPRRRARRRHARRGRPMSGAASRHAGLLALGAALAFGPAARADDAVSMFDERSYRSLVAESKAFRPGDVLTVLI